MKRVSLQVVLTVVRYSVLPCIEGRVEFGDDFVILLAGQRFVETVL